MTWLKRLGAGAAVLALALVLWLIVGNDVANRRLVAVERAWAESPGPLDAFLARHPAVPTNEAARRLEEASAVPPLAIDLVPRGERDGAAKREASKEAGRIDGLFRDYLDSELQRPDGAARRPEGETAERLAARRPALEDVCRILEGPEPRWFSEVEKGFAARIPNLLGHLRLQRVLLASALASSAGGDVTHADRLLEASWRLNESLRVRGELISQLIAIAVGRMEAGVLRKVPVPPPAWIDRLSGLQPRESIFESFRGEAWATGQAMRSGVSLDPVTGEPRSAPRVVELLRGPLERLSFAAYLGGLRAMVIAAAARPVSDGSLHHLRAAFDTGASRWGRAPTTGLPDLVACFARADRLAVDLELTRKVLELRAARGAAKEWPASEPGLEASVVKDARWIYGRTPDGRATLALSRPLDWGKTFGIVLPERWVAAN